MYKWFENVENALSILSEADGNGKVAVFDADGTLWPGDLGEDFFKWQIKNQLAPGLKGMKNPWDHYLELDKNSTADANAWITKLNTGLALSTLQEQAKNFYNQHFKNQLNPLLKTLIENFKKQNFQVWICSASMRWAIEPALIDLNIPLKNLVGTESVIDSKGILTNEIITPIPYGRGKKEALAKKLLPPPTFVAGNSLGDSDMLEWATDFPLVIQYKPGLPNLFGSERALRQEAEVKGWLIQIFGT